MAQRFVTNTSWSELDIGEMVSITRERVKITLRAEERVRGYLSSGGYTNVGDGEILCVIGEGELELDVAGYCGGHIRFEGGGRIWIAQDEIDQAIIVRDARVFTEVVPRPEMSPEIRHMQQIMRQNQIERDLQTRAWEQRIAELERRETAARAAVGEGSEDVSGVDPAEPGGPGQRLPRSGRGRVAETAGSDGAGGSGEDASELGGDQVAYSDDQEVGGSRHSGGKRRAKGDAEGT